MKIKINNEFGLYLKNIRIQKKLSLRDVERGTGISNAYLAQIENSRSRKISAPEIINKLAEFYEISVNSILTKAGYLLYNINLSYNEIKDAIDKTREEISLINKIIIEKLLQYNLKEIPYDSIKELYEKREELILVFNILNKII